ncbi:MAG: hypothetical protein AAGE94_05015 [Acidobacteriota bacterium]
MSDEGGIPQLIFSTRAAAPRTASDASREIIAETPGVDDSIRSAFAMRADLTGSVLRAAELPPIYSVSRVDESQWLFTRAISLGAYGKRRHQLLVHGLVLGHAHVARLDGHLLLLDAPVMQAAGLTLAHEHPGRGGALPPLHLPREVDPSWSARRCVERLDRLSPLLEAWDERFPTLFESLRTQGRITAVVTTPPPDPRLAEWLLLHLHRDDRAMTDVHTWHAWDEPIPHRLLLVTEDDVAPLRRHLPELDESRLLPSPEAGGPAFLSRALRARSVSAFFSTVVDYRITYRARHGGWEPLAADDAVLALRAGLGSATEADTPRLRELLRRRSARLFDDVQRLAELWRERDVDGFATHLDEVAARRSPPGVDAVRVVFEVFGESPLIRWVLLALASAHRASPDDRPIRRDALQMWRHLMSVDRLPELFTLIEGAGGVGLATPILASYVELDAADAARRDGGLDTVAWPRYLAWQLDTGRPITELAAKIETIAVETDAVAWLDHLRTTSRQAGLDVFARRLTFQHLVPRASESRRQALVRDEVDRILATTGQDATLRTLFGDGKIAPLLLAACVAWLEDHPDGLSRVIALLAHQGRVMPQTCAAACGDVLAHLSWWPTADRLAELFTVLIDARGESLDGVDFADTLMTAWATRLRAGVRTVRGGDHAPYLASALGMVLICRGEYPVKDHADIAVLELLLDGVVVVDHLTDHWLRAGRLEAAALDSVVLLRGRLSGYLRQLMNDKSLGGSRFERLVSPESRWCDLLLDELLRRPSGPGDPRWIAGLQLAWRRFAAAPDSAAAIRVVRFGALVDDPDAVLDVARRVLTTAQLEHATRLIVDARRGRRS